MWVWYEMVRCGSQCGGAKRRSESAPPRLGAWARAGDQTVGAAATAASPTPLHLRRSRRLGYRFEGVWTSMATPWLIDAPTLNDGHFRSEVAPTLGQGASPVKDLVGLIAPSASSRHLIVEMHGPSRLGHGGPSHGASALGSLLEDAQDLLGLASEVLTARADGREEPMQHVGQMMLEGHVAQPARSITLLQDLQAVSIGIERIQVGEDDIALDLS